MNAKQWQKARETLEQVLEAEPRRRQARLLEICGDDETVRKSVEQMLQSQAPADFLEAPVGGAAVGMLSDGLLPANLGELAGPFRLEQVLSSGGSATVYRARRADSELDQVLAIKVVRHGVAGTEMQRRFRQERRTLARLEHPHIARFIDAGILESDLPFLAMELVDGEPLDRYCDKRRLAVADRLRLFCKICVAVNFAHQNLIVHRDLKPGNILVDSQGEPKLLDFGIAKLLESDDPSSAADPTITTYRIMTPQYASPEQIRGEPTATTSDVYSLGVILYELLTGHRPYDVKAKSQNELQRLICEVTPATPSSAVSCVIFLPQSDGSTRTITPETIAQERADKPERLRRRLSGDLDTIVMKALHKESARRYASAEQLAEDISRYLTGQPVLARPDSWTYRASKFVRRNKITVAAAALVFLSLAGGVIGTTIGLRRARTAEAVAAAETKNAKVAAQTTTRVNEFLQDMLAAADPETGNKNVTVREVLDKTAAGIATELQGEPLVKASIQETIGKSYTSLGLHGEAEPLLLSSLQTRTLELGRESLDVASSLHHLAELRIGQGKYAEAEELLRKSLSIVQELAGEEHRDAARLENKLATVLYHRGRYPEAEAMQRSALALTRQCHGENHRYTASSLNNLGLILIAQHDLERAEPLLRQALALRRTLLGDHDFDVAVSTSSLASLLLKKREFAEAEALYRETWEIREELLSADHYAVAEAMSNLALVMKRTGRLDEAEDLYRDSLDVRVKALGPQHPDVGSNLNNLAALLEEKGDLASAEDYCRQALDIVQKTLGANHMRTAMCLNNLARILALKGKTDEAVTLLRDAIQCGDQSTDADPVEIANWKRTLARILYSQKEDEEAESLLRQTLEVERRNLPPTNIQLAFTLNALGLLLIANERYAEGAEIYDECLRITMGNRPDDEKHVADVKANLGRCLLELGRPEEAVPLLEESVAVCRRDLGQDHSSTANRQFSLGRALLLTGDPAGAETHLRRSLAAKLNHLAEDHWDVAATRSFLGEALAAQERFVEAEPHLVEAFVILSAESTVPEEWVEHNGQQIIALYEAWDKTERAADWRAKLSEVISRVEATEE